MIQSIMIVKVLNIHNLVIMIKVSRSVKVLKFNITQIHKKQYQKSNLLNEKIR